MDLLVKDADVLRNAILSLKLLCPKLMVKTETNEASA